MMKDFFSLFEIAGSRWHEYSMAQFLTSLHGLQSDFQTSLLEIRSLEDGQTALLALLAGGQVVNLYRVSGGVKRLDGSDLSIALACGGSDVTMRLLALTPNTLRLVKILLEQPGQVTSAYIDSQDLPRVLERAGQGLHPVLAHCAWDQAHGFALLPGHGLASDLALFVAPNQVSYTEGALAGLLESSEPLCRVQLHRSDPLTLAWQEYFLYYSFKGLIKDWFTRLSVPRRQPLLAEILRELNFTASANGWNIKFSLSDVSDQAVFSSPQDARYVYHRLLEILKRHASPVLGESMSKRLLHEASSGLYRPERGVEILP
jgi:hypothetical protein